MYLNPMKRYQVSKVTQNNDAVRPTIQPYFKENLSKHHHLHPHAELMVEQRMHSSVAPMGIEENLPEQHFGISALRRHFKQTFSAICAKEDGKCKRLFKIIMKIACCFFFVGFFIATIFTDSSVQSDCYWCDDAGLVIVVGILITFLLVYFHVLKFLFRKRLIYNAFKPLIDILGFFRSKRLFRAFLYSILIISLIIFLVIDTAGDRSRLISASGILVLLLFGFLFSKAPLKVLWPIVFWGMTIQFVFGILIIRWPVGKEIFKCFGHHVSKFLAFTEVGSSFVFGVLVKDFQVFAINVFCVVIFFSFFIHILFYYGIMQWFIIKVGSLLQNTLGTTACESTNAAANIFLSLSEAPFLIKPYLSQMTKSELHAIMTGGFATVAGSVLSAYISFGVDPVHLLSASVMSAPAALAFSKLFYPEIEVSYTNAKDIKIMRGKESNVLHAAVEGVVASLSLISHGIGTLVAFNAFIAFIDAVFDWICGRINIPGGTCSLANASGYGLMPLSYIMGVPWGECYVIGQLIGTKTIINEFVAYIKLAEVKSKCLISKRSEIIATYALCGFSNFGSMGIQVGGIGALAPSRRRDLTEIALRAMIAGSFTCFLTACVAGTLISSEDFESSIGNCPFPNSTALDVA